MPQGTKLTQAHKRFLDKLGTDDPKKMWRAIAAEFGLTYNRSATVALRYISEHTRATERAQRKKELLKKVTKKRGRKRKRPTDAERFRRLAGDIALTDEEIHERRLYYNG